MSLSTYPLDGLTIADGSITVDMMLQQPKRITRYVSDLAAKQLFAGSIFTPDNTVGGAIIFDQLTKNDVYAVKSAGVVYLPFR